MNLGKFECIFRSYGVPVSLQNRNKIVSIYGTNAGCNFKDIPRKRESKEGTLRELIFVGTNFRGTYLRVFWPFPRNIQNMA